MADSRSVADFEGPWVDVDFQSSLIARCKQHWNTPISQLPDVMVATYLNQKIAFQQMMLEADRRIKLALFDGTEMYDGHLADALSQSQGKPTA